MPLQVSQYLNKTILVSVPALFEDVRCRACKLVGAELQGLWLESDDLTRSLLADDQQGLASAAPVVFVPFAQIAGVLVPTQVPAGLLSAYAPAQPTSRAASRKSSVSAPGKKR